MKKFYLPSFEILFRRQQSQGTTDKVAGKTRDPQGQGGGRRERRGNLLAEEQQAGDQGGGRQKRILPTVIRGGRGEGRGRFWRTTTAHQSIWVNLLVVNNVGGETVSSAIRSD